MKNIPTLATQEDVIKILSAVDIPLVHKLNPVDVKYAAMAYLGACRHEYMSPDWMVCQYAWEYAFENIRIAHGHEISKVAKNSLKKVYQKKGLHPTKGTFSKCWD